MKPNQRARSLASTQTKYTPMSTLLKGRANNNTKILHTEVWTIDWEFEFYEFWNFLNFTIFNEFQNIILIFVKFKLSHSSPPISKKLFVADTAVNFWIKNSLMSAIQDSLTRQQFSCFSSAWSRADYYKVYESSAASLSSQCQNQRPQLPTLHIQQLPQCNRL